jgi:hypothetical protein
VKVLGVVTDFEFENEDVVGMPYCEWVYVEFRIVR